MKVVIPLLAVVALAGCSSTVHNTNKETGIPTPTISATDSIARIAVGEVVKGEGCAKEFLVFFKSGDNKFLQVHGTSGGSPIDRAKAAASYKALTANKGLSTDIIVQPTWEITESKQFFGLLTDDVCAKVIGYRGVIEGFKPADTVTKPAQVTADGASGGFFGWFGK